MGLSAKICYINGIGSIVQTLFSMSTRLLDKNSVCVRNLHPDYDEFCVDWLFNCFKLITVSKRYSYWQVLKHLQATFPYFNEIVT